MIDGIEFTAPDPRRDDPKYSYGIIPEQPKPEDILYRLSYDADKSFLLLNRFVVQTFNWESNADNTLSELFKKEGILKGLRGLFSYNSELHSSKEVVKYYVCRQNTHQNSRKNIL